MLLAYYSDVFFRAGFFHIFQKHLELFEKDPFSFKYTGINYEGKACWWVELYCFMLFCLFSAEAISPKAKKFTKLILRTNLKALNVLLKVIVKTDSLQWTYVTKRSA